jgi:hypothetical protein
MVHLQTHYKVDIFYPLYSVPTKDFAFMFSNFAYNELPIGRAINIFFLYIIFLPAYSALVQQRKEATQENIILCLRNVF